MTDIHRKVRPDAVLKNLPEKLQEEILEHTNKNSLRKTCEWLKKKGIKVSGAAMGRWRIWYLMRAECETIAEAVETLMDWMKRQRPGWSPEEMQAFGDMFFNMLALKQKDNLSWVRMQRERSRREGLELQREKVKLEFQKHKDHVAEQKKKAEEALEAGSRDGAISRETLDRISKELKLL